MSIDPADPFAAMTALADAYSAGTLKPSAVARAHLDRIERLDTRISSYQAVYAEDAMQAAEAADRAIAAGHRIGPFHGIPFALKDICDVEGRVTTGGSMARRDRISPATGTVAARLVAGGGVLLGKTRTVEHALGGWGTNQHMGTPRNPWDMAVHRVPGGSSAGSAAAVAAGLAVCAVGTDTGGSVRLPAAFCGLTGLKVTAGRLPLDGIIPLSHTLDTPGPMARSVADTLLMFEVMDGRAGYQIDRARADASGYWAVLGRGVRGLRLGIMANPERALCSSEVLAAYDSAVARLAGLGAETEVFHQPRPADALIDATTKLISAEGYFYHRHLYDRPELPMDEDCRARFLAGRNVSAVEYLAALEDHREASAAMARATAGLDALLTPTMAEAAPPVAAVDQAISPAIFTRPVNYHTMCGLAVPSGLTAGGLPTSLQIIARGGDEAVALRIGAAFEGAGTPVWPEL